MKITVKDFLKESWLGALGHAEDSTVDLPTIAAEQEAQAREEGPSEPVVEARDEERAIRLSDDEVSAFQRASAALLHKDWSHSIGLGGESAGAAIKVGDVEFKIVAADAPLPRDDPQLASSTSDTSAKTSRGTRKKKRRKRRPSGK
jgi:hypothetical protein